MPYVCMYKWVSTISRVKHNKLKVLDKVSSENNKFQYNPKIRWLWKVAMIRKLKIFASYIFQAMLYWYTI